MNEQILEKDLRRLRSFQDWSLALTLAALTLGVPVLVVLMYAFFAG